MRRLPIILSGLLVLQVAGAVALSLTGPDYSAFRPNQPLIAFDRNAVKELAIDESGGDSVTLRRDGDKWTLPGLHDFPADDKKVTSLLTRLSDLKKGLPVAVSGSAPERFKVTEDKHERRIVLRDGDKTLGEVLIGSSPSYRRVNVRTPDDDAVYSVALEIYDVGARPVDWMQRDLLTVPEADIVRVELPTLALVRDDKAIVVEGLGENEKTVEDEANKLIRKIATLSFTTVEGKGDEALARVADPDLTVTVKLKDDSTVTYRLKKAADKDDYLLASSKQDYLFRVAKFAVDGIVDASREKLVQPLAAEGAPQTGAASPDDGSHS